MKNFLRQGLVKKVILFGLVVGMVSPAALAYTDGGYPLGTSALRGIQPLTVDTGRLVAEVAPSVQNLNVSTATGSATVSFSVNTNATATVWIKDSTDTIVRTLAFSNSLTGGQTYSYTWNGTNNDGQPVAGGSYKAQVVAYNVVSSDIKNFSFNYSAGQVATAPVVSVSVNPTSIDPTKNQTATVSYTLNTQSSLRVEVKSGNTVVRTLRAQAEQAAGSYQIVWDGKNSSFGNMAPGTYSVEVYAVNNAGTDTKSTSITVVNAAPTVTAPVLSNLYASPTPFNPNNENTRIYFTLDKTADVTVSILDGSSTVRNLVSNTSLSAGTYFYEWNGRDASSYLVSDKVYTARVMANNSAGSDTKTASVEVRTSGTGNTCDIITSHYVNPTSFNPEDREAMISYTLSRTADVTVKIKDGSNTVKTLTSYQTQSAGTRTVYWNGRDTNGSYVDDQSYTYEIRASVSGCSDDVESSSVRVLRNTTGENDWPSTDEDLITDVSVRNEVFDPTEGERSTIEFTLDRRADLIVQVMDGNNVIDTLRDANDQAGGDYSYTWDGRDSGNDIVDDDVYQFRIMADDGDDTDTDRAYVEVDTDGIIIGFPDSDRCAGYRDVSVNSPFCKAIQLMSERGIFSGYSDGTFRPNANINRAETVKVITLALGYDVNTGGTYSLGYRDTNGSAWYAPYLYVAKRYGIATGYPDNTFRPSSTINRVELLRVFLEGNQTNLYTCSTQPYDDTPITPDTRWYMKYACYAKDNGLMGSDGYNGYNDYYGYNYNTSGEKLYPAEAMTRGDVANLFYDFEVKGLYSDYVLNRTGRNNGDTYVCTDYDRNGNCTNYELQNGSNSDRYCVEYDRYNDCVRYEYTTSTNSNRYSYDYTNSSDGYYVYRNGRYVWVSY